MERHHVAVQMEEEQQWEKDNGPIVKTADQLWKYSGEVEPTDFDAIENNEQMNHFRFIKSNIKGKDLSIFLSKRDTLIIDYFYKNHNHTMEHMAADIGISVTVIRKTMARYLKLKRNHGDT